MKTLRYISQGVFLSLFLYLFIKTESAGTDELGYPVRIFLDIDPLLSITSFLASHELPVAMYLSIALIAVTAVMGRVFCGWICPFGTIHNIAGSFHKGTPRAHHRKYHALKYYLLFFILAASLFSVQWAGLFDPLSLLVRSLTLGMYPALYQALDSTSDALYHMPFQRIAEWSDYSFNLLRHSILSFQKPHYLQSFFISVIFILILLSNLVERRLWCRYLCPLGALLGILSRFSIIGRTISEGCTTCGICTDTCQSGAAGERPEDWSRQECMYCMECDDSCPAGAVRFGIGRKNGTMLPDIGKRAAILSGAAGILSVPLIRVSPVYAGRNVNASLIRPPGAVEEKLFLQKCVRCGACMKVCLTNGLQPALWQAGIEGLWTPFLVPRIGYCEFRCTLCGQVCPTGAIRKLKQKEKEQVKIGVAIIDTGRCLPHAFAIPCIACQEVCPTPEKSIWIEEVTVTGREGIEISLKQPHVDPSICVGCGTCESVCPVMSKPAIYVINTGETRSDKNRIVL